MNQLIHSSHNSALLSPSSQNGFESADMQTQQLDSIIISGSATGGSRRDPGHGNRRRDQQMPLRSRMSTLFAALVVVAGSVFLFEYVLFVGHAVDGRLRRRGDPPIPVLQPITEKHDETNMRLGVVVPAYSGDLNKALNSLKYWPTTCYQSTLRKMDLILYYAGGAEDEVENVLPGLAETGGRCFANTRLVLGNLTAEENVYPKGPSVQFYKMFLNEGLRRQLSEYQVLALIEWDVIVAHESSFQKLYQAAFGGVEPFWVKGSTLEGVNFHETVVLPQSRFVIGHINGNALYNNTDQAFVDFIEYTLTRWDYDHSYDVALWATIADLPYSWPLWQRYSRKFVATDLISNVGFLDVSTHTVGKAVASDTLFIHGSLTGGGASMFEIRAALDTSRAHEFVGESKPADQCTSACGPSTQMLVPEGTLTQMLAPEGTSTVCDRSCFPGENGPRFSGLNCGAGDPEKLGGNCRLCYKDPVEAGKREAELSQRNVVRDVNMPQEHVIMCDTLLPPQTSACSSKCLKKVDTVCDESCGRGRYGDYNCNWRGYGENCRFCFHDREAALKADVVAQRRGGRVIMCHTYEPPSEVDIWTKPPPALEEVDVNEGDDPDEEDNADEEGNSGVVSEEKPLTPDQEPYVNDITRGQICVFMVGSTTFLPEMHVSIKSIAHFMPGIRIAIAVHPDNVSLFERTLGHIGGVHVSPAFQFTQQSALLADLHCGEGTRLIYYMNMGELLSRAFTPKDTHSVKGDLLIMYAEVDRVGDFSVQRSLATTAVLGFSSPSFSFGMDIMLPAETNQQLREVLLSDPDAGIAPGRPSGNDEVRALRAISSFRGVFIPEVLAALAYSRNPPGVRFVNPRQWVTYHMFEPASIWDIPLVKPRFACSFDMSPVNSGYDVAKELELHLGHFQHGGACETGFIPFDNGSLRPKAYIEFGEPTGKSMPSLSGISVSVVFNVGADVHPDSLRISLASVVDKFRDASEAVVVFNEPPLMKEQLMEVIKAQDKGSNVDVFAVETPASLGVESGSDLEWTGLHADEYCTGDFVMHMEPGDVFATDQVQYDNIFHFRRPVIPINRLATDKPDPFEQCVGEAVSFALGKPVVHNFQLLRSLVFPREAYSNLRRFLYHDYKADVETAVAHGRTSCKAGVKKDEPPPVIPRNRYEMNLLGAFMWHNMHDAVHWKALHPLDIQLNEWPTRVEKYHLYCDLRAYGIPTEAQAAQNFVEAAGKVDSRAACDSFRQNA